MRGMEDQGKPISKPEPPREPSQQETAAMIADELGETEKIPRAQIVTIVRGLGRTQARRLLQQALDLEANGGMMVLDGSRRRTLGGIYFHLAYTTGKTKRGGKPLRRPMRKPQSGEAQTGDDVLPLRWEDRIAVIEEAEVGKGNANVKITVVGRPGKIVDRKTCIVTVMESTKVPALPKGLPTPTNATTKYTVYIGVKQWKKVSESIRDPEDVLIVEGFPTLDPQASAIAVFATNATTKHLQQVQRETQKAKGEAAEE
jgi:hypothetical protein